MVYRNIEIFLKLTKCIYIYIYFYLYSIFFQGINEAFVVKLFDPLLSPRNHAIVALKRN